MFKELLSLPVTLTIQTRVNRRQIILLCWTHVPCDVIIKRRTIPIRLSRNFFQGGGGGGVLARRPENSLDNVFFLFVCFFFLVLSLFYSLQRGSNGFIT